MPRKSILVMTNSEAKKFFLKSESYFNGHLPSYFDFKELLAQAEKLIGQSKLNEISISKNAVSQRDDVNYKILMNKDGQYAWRPVQLIHPLLYVDLVNTITKQENWDSITDRFFQFQSDKRVKCISIPVESTSAKNDQAEQILNWWENLEQAQIKFALDYNYCIQTDITNCYSSIYTHTIPWALHEKEWAKKNRKNRIGNVLDTKIQSMQNGQTNGIPQGSVLMDFIAEMILGYADMRLIDLTNSNKLNDFQILRYRDDYRIFSNQLETAEKIMKLLTEVLFDLNLKINSQKTFLCDDIIIDAIKPDKLYWTSQYASIANKTSNGEWHFQLSLQKHLLQIKILGDKFPNCGQVKKALTDIYKYRVHKSILKKKPDDIYQLISIVTAIMLKNPGSIQHCVTILAGLFKFLEPSEINSTITSILSKYDSLPNTDFIELWLQRISIIKERDKEYKSKMAKKVKEPNNINLWNSDWLKSNKQPDESLLVNEIKISELTLEIPIEEIDMFNDDYNF